MQVSFYKYHGTANDFIMIDNREGKINLSNKQVKKICARHTGIGADGLILILNAADADFEMVYYNADGNPGSMCGNGGRCAIKFAAMLGIKKNYYAFQAIDG
ncbi:MAG: diaminopimelate epimerase, partial [Chitinophagaceae bacterium]